MVQLVERRRILSKKGGDDYSKRYLTFEAIEDSKFFFSTNALQYSLNNGSTWTTLAANTYTPTVNAGSKILWKQTGLTPSSSSGIGTFSATGNFNVSGNIMSLYYGDSFVGQKDLTGKNLAFFRLFTSCAKLINAENLVLPATTLTSNCYQTMFYRCTSLTVAPKILPATTLGPYCYNSMFSGCTSLTAAPELPATTLTGSCYLCMFQGCKSLTTAPELPATTLALSCYENMFKGCTSLTAAPELPATTLAEWCYRYMFTECTSLTTTPELPATELASGCYQDMFSGCTSLTTAPKILSATTLTINCYTNMFNGCTSLTAAPELPATTLTGSCYNNMFGGCTSLTTSPALPATTLASYCYASMFSGCTSLTAAPELPATTLASFCYPSMFQNCTSLMTAPELPATTLMLSCYMSMFRGCRNLNYIKCLATDISANSCTASWVDGVSATGTFVKDTSMASWQTGNDGIPSGWIVPKHDYSEDYLTFTALEDTTFTFSRNSLQYSLDDGATWTTLAAGTYTPTVTAGSKIMWKQTELTPVSDYGIGTFSATRKFEASGNIMSLYYGDNFVGQTNLTGKYSAFCILFSSNTKLINAENLILPATTLADYCYQNMFYGCTALTTAPELPATTLADSCYSQMFRNCTALNYIKCLATNISASNCTTNWVKRVAATGTFVKDASMSSWTTGISGIPSGWTVEDA